MRAKNSAGFEIKPVRLNQKGFTYETFRLTGWLNGRRVRKQFKSRDEAQGEKLRLEVEAANTSGQVRTVVTRLNDEQVREAEAVYQQLAGRSLTDAVQWFLTNYRPPVAEITLTAAVTGFLAEKERHVRPLALRDYRRTLARFCATLPDRCAHTVTTAEVEAFLLSLNVGKKRWNIRPNLSEWLARFPLERFPVVPKNARRMIQHVREKFGLTDDVLRHTFISMHVARFKSLGEAALEAGNSEAMIRKHYLNLVSEQDAAAFWDLSPKA